MKRNCLFMLVDCLRADKCWGNTRTAKTATIDSLCERGTTFTQAIATTTTTTPSVSSILTGLSPLTHGVRSLHGYKLNYRIKTLAQILKENGYNTYAEVTGPLGPEVGLSKGFDEYNLRTRDNGVYSSWYELLLRKFLNKEFKEPWFIFLHFFELHHPRSLHHKYHKADFGANTYERALSSLDASLGELVRYVDDDTVIVLHGDHGERIAQTMLQEYPLRLTNYLLTLLKRRLGFRGRNTLQLLGHGFHVYDYLVRVPLVFVGKGIFPENRWISEQVRQIDIAPTIIEALKLGYPSNHLPKLHLPAEICGRSLLPLLEDQSWEEVSAYCEACGVTLGDIGEWLAAIRTPRYKYICKPYSNYPWEELYDLKNDPQEKRNLIAVAPEVAQELRKQLEKIRRASEEGQIREGIRKLKDSGRL